MLGREQPLDVDQASTHGLGIRLQPEAGGFQWQGGSRQPTKEDRLGLARGLDDGLLQSCAASAMRTSPSEVLR